MAPDPLHDGPAQTLGGARNGERDERSISTCVVKRLPERRL